MTKKEMKERCQALLKNPPGTTFSGDDHDFLVTVFEGHPDFKARTKGQVFLFQVRMNNTLGFPSKGFWIIRNANTHLRAVSPIANTKILRHEYRKKQSS